MRHNLNFKLGRYFTIMVGIIFVLSITVIYEASTINKLKNKQVSEFFLEAKLNREQDNARTLQTLKTLIDDENLSKEQKDIAEAEYIKIVSAANNEIQIELILKSKGYDKVIAFIMDDKVRVIVKYHKRLSNKQLSEIRDTVMSVTRIKDIQVVIK